MSFLECTIATCAQTAEQDAELLTTLGALSVTFEMNDDLPLWEPDPEGFDLQGVQSLKALFTEEWSMPALKEHLERYALKTVAITPLPDKEWATEWQQYFSIQTITPHFWILPQWEKMPLDENIVALRLTPGLAFGTGTHPTTKLCLQWLATHDLQHKRILDFGCGSGILAIAACLLGAKSAHAVDHDPQALLATVENARHNDVAHAITVGSEANNAAAYDLVIANILAQPLVTLAPLLCTQLAPKGTLVLSGILKSQVPEVQAAYQEHICFTAPFYMEEWALLCGHYEK